jgi:hypothetical protein
MTEISYKTQIEHPFFREGLKNKYEGHTDAKRKLRNFFKRQPCVCAQTCGDKYTLCYLGLVLPRMKNISVEFIATAITT